MAASAHSRTPNLYLIGFMGVGKSAVGRGVAQQLDLQFIDSDQAIEAAAGRSIQTLFAEEGEAGFRARERQFVEGGHPARGAVIACGGGLPCQPGMRERLLQLGLVIALIARPETILARTAGNQKRPLLNVEDPEARVRALLQEREPVYLNTGVAVCADGRTLPEIVDNVVRIYRRSAPGWEPVVAEPSAGGGGV